MERWQSGRMYLFRKQAGAQAPRGFESPPFRNFARNAKSSEKGESCRTSGGQGDIPPQTPPVALPASLLAFWEISGRKLHGARGEKTRMRLRTRWVLTSFYFSFLIQTRIAHRSHSSSKRPTSASIESATLQMHIRTAPALPTVFVFETKTVGRVRHTDMRCSRTIFNEKKRTSTASR